MIKLTRLRCAKLRPPLIGRCFLGKAMLPYGRDVPNLYLTGDAEVGDLYYREAIEGFRKLGERYSEVSARLYHAQEARFANVPNHETMLNAAKDAWQKLDRGSHPVLDRLKEPAPALPPTNEKTPLFSSSTGSPFSEREREVLKDLVP